MMTITRLKRLVWQSLAFFGLVPSKARASARHKLPPGLRDRAFWVDDTNLNNANWNGKWHRRASIAARQVRRGERVLDLGCGDMHIETRLPRGCSYQPCDVAARDSRTIVCDFNLGEVPAAAKYDVVILLGVLEFVHGAEQLIAKLPKYDARSWCISYHPSDIFGKNEAALKMLGRPLLMSEPELLQQIEKAGHRVARRIPIGDNDMLYVTEVASSGRDSTDTLI